MGIGKDRMEKNKRTIEIDQAVCVGCGLCAEVCPTGAISVVFKKAMVNPLACNGCGQCLGVCRTGAIHWKGEQIRPEIRESPFARRGWFGRGRRVSEQRAYTRPDTAHRDLHELRQRLEDLKKKADEIVKRIERL